MNHRTLEQYKEEVFDRLSEDVKLNWLYEMSEQLCNVEEYCNYLLENNEVEINGVKYFKQESDDVITRAILEKIQMSKDKDLDPFLDIEIDEEDLPF